MAATATKYTTGHVGLNVSDVQKSMRFYQDVFGLTAAGVSEDPEKPFALLARDGELVITLWQQSEGAFPNDRPGLHHLSFRVDTLEQVREAEQKLRELGATIYHGGTVAHSEGARSAGVFFEDPDGIRLEIFAPDGGEGLEAPHGAAPTCGFF